MVLTLIPCCVINIALGFDCLNVLRISLFLCSISFSYVYAEIKGVKFFAKDIFAKTTLFVVFFCFATNAKLYNIFNI